MYIRVYHILDFFDNFDGFFFLCTNIIKSSEKKFGLDWGSFDPPTGPPFFGPPVQNKKFQKSSKYLIWYINRRRISCWFQKCIGPWGNFEYFLSFGPFIKGKNDWIFRNGLNYGVLLDSKCDFDQQTDLIYQWSGPWHEIVLDWGLFTPPPHHHHPLNPLFPGKITTEDKIKDDIKWFHDALLDWTNEPNQQHISYVRE